MALHYYYIDRPDTRISKYCSGCIRLVTHKDAYATRAKPLALPFCLGDCEHLPKAPNYA